MEFVDSYRTGLAQISGRKSAANVYQGVHNITHAHERAVSSMVVHRHVDALILVKSGDVVWLKGAVRRLVRIEVLNDYRAWVIECDIEGNQTGARHFVVSRQDLVLRDSGKDQLRK